MTVEAVHFLQKPPPPSYIPGQPPKKKRKLKEIKFLLSCSFFSLSCPHSFSSPGAIVVRGFLSSFPRGCFRTRIRQAGKSYGSWRRRKRGRRRGGDPLIRYRREDTGYGS